MDTVITSIVDARCSRFGEQRCRLIREFNWLLRGSSLRFHRRWARGRHSYLRMIYSAAHSWTHIYIYMCVRHRCLSQMVHIDWRPIPLDPNQKSGKESSVTRSSRPGIYPPRGWNCAESSASSTTLWIRRLLISCVFGIFSVTKSLLSRRGAKKSFVYRKIATELNARIRFASVLHNGSFSEEFFRRVMRVQ